MKRKLSQEDILDCIDRLKYAKEYIKEGRRYICCQLYNYPYGTEELSSYLANWIQSMLGDHTSIEAYLSTYIYHKEHKLYLIDELINTPSLRTKVKNTRIKWLNYMIRELKKELK